MIKNKDDEFLGDNITSNVKYADNEWQAQGTVDRGSVYTKEPLLDLLFEGYNYNKTEGDYIDYVARASTSIISGTDQKAYVAAKLQHDLYVLDAQFYATSAIDSSNNIFSLSSYLNKAVALSNPLFDDRSAAKCINLLGITRKANNRSLKDFEWKNEKLKVTPLFDVVKYFLPEFYVDENFKVTENIKAKFNKLVNRYRTELPESFTLVFDSKSSVDAAALSKLTIDSTIEEYLELLNHVDYGALVSAEGSSTKEFKILGNVADVFIADFSIYQHNSKDIKMPFYNRGSVKASDGNVFKETDDTRTFKTRFIANSLSENLYNSRSELSQPIYLERLNDIVEEALFSPTAEIYKNRPEIKEASRTSTILANELFNGGKYSHLWKTNDVAYNTLLENYTKAIDNIETSITLYCPSVFSEYSAVNSPENSWGIHFVNEEATENIFQDIDNTYKLFNNVLIGYRLADTLIANRTFAGGIYYLISQRDSDVDAPLTLDVPLQERSVSCGFYNCSITVSNQLSYYPTVTAINALYKLGHAIDVSFPEIATEEHNYDFTGEIKDWLRHECFLFKGNVYGDYVEELNFLQDLTPDSDVHFKHIRIKSTEIPYNRQQDSKYEIPYIEQTAPLINNTIENKEGLGVYGSEAFAGVGNLLGKDKDLKGNATQNTIPPFIYDYDKGNQSALMDQRIDSRLKNATGNAQRINSKDGAGTLVADQRISSPTIDELWTFLKYLTESDGSGIDAGINERLPKFYGVQKEYVANTISNLPKNSLILENTVNPRAQKAENTKTIDILNWKPSMKKEPELHWSPSITDKSKKVELQFGGYEITRYIEKIYDYEIKPFSRRPKELVDDATYEFNSEVLSDKNNLTGYLEKLYNSAILAFDLPEVSVESKLKSMVNIGLLYADVLDKSYSAILEDDLDKSATTIFAEESDKNLITPNQPLHNTAQRKKAFDDIANILNYHKADGETKEASKHNHYKKYLENPKNLKEIERDLETIRQNLQTLAEFSVASFTSLGYADRAQNRGTLHQLHKNAYSYLSTFIYSVNNTIANLNDETYNVKVSLNDLETDLNNINESLIIEDSDKRVVFDDGEYEKRYLRSEYDASVIDLNSNVTEHSRARHYRYRPNETLLSEVYLAADGTWRSVHEHTVLPVIYSEN